MDMLNTNLGNLAKVFDDLSIALNDLLLDIQPELSSGVGRILDSTSIERFQGVTNFKVSVRCREYAGNPGRESIGSTGSSSGGGRSRRKKVLRGWGSTLCKVAGRHGGPAGGLDTCGIGHGGRLHLPPIAEGYLT
ncbi:hypothetical protein PMIN07_003936 [Paraphaeosphaeria minitans]